MELETTPTMHGVFGPELCGPKALELFHDETRVVVDRYLVDPASSHTLVSKIKPCMSKYKQSIL